MAHKDHSLDGLIAGAALHEFMETGFEKASMRHIAAAAGVTVGAIYTRYSSKDVLFCSLVQPLIDRIQAAFASIKEDYYSAGCTPEGMTASMNRESAAILHLLFDEYDRAVLLLCRSAGSSLEHFFDIVVQRKTEETVAFFRKTGTAAPDERVLRILLRSQFHSYYQVISEGCGLEAAKQILQAVMTYSSGGWKALFELSGQ